ncbi:MAG: ATP-binding protein [Thermacetogeniaceae bacterium]
MRTYSTQTSILLHSLDERRKIPGQVLEDSGYSADCTVQRLLEQLEELANENQILKKKLLVHQKREADLRKELVNYKLLAESTPVFIIQGDRVRLINHCSHAFTGYTAEEIGQTDFWQVIHPDWREVVQKQCEAHYRGDVLESVLDIRLISEAGPERWAEVKTRTIVYERQPAVLALVGDISERKRTEQVLLTALREAEGALQARADLFQAQKMEAVGQLAGGVAHQLNNQLMVIYACVDLYLSRLTRDDLLRRLLLRIRNSARISANLTRQLLIFGGRNPLFKTPTNLNNNAEELKNILVRLQGEQITIELQTSPDLWLVKADTSNIDQAITNLVLNACDAMPGGGAITIKTANVYADRDEQQRAIPGRYVCLSVSDTGVGIDKENLPHIFEPFFTTKEPDKGVGLGLSVAYGIIQAHNGWIEVDSTPGLGSTVRLYLPAMF